LVNVKQAGEGASMYIHWEEKLELGNDLIDTQHRILVLLCRKLDIAIKTGQSEQTIRWVMMELKKFTEFHFISEENLMREIGYPKIDAHALVHTGLLIQLESMLAKISHHKEFPEDLLYFLNQWLLKHIVQDDLKIAEFAKYADERPIGEDLYGQYLLSSKSQ
jgi:hemerythrin-like metal-binding protein